MGEETPQNTNPEAIGSSRQPVLSLGKKIGLGALAAVAGAQGVSDQFSDERWHLVGQEAFFGDCEIDDATMDQIINATSDLDVPILANCKDRLVVSALVAMLLDQETLVSADQIRSYTQQLDVGDLKKVIRRYQNNDLTPLLQNELMDKMATEIDATWNVNTVERLLKSGDKKHRARYFPNTNDAGSAAAYSRLEVSIKKLMDERVFVDRHKTGRIDELKGADNYEDRITAAVRGFPFEQSVVATAQMAHSRVITRSYLPNYFRNDEVSLEKKIQAYLTYRGDLGAMSKDYVPIRDFPAIRSLVYTEFARASTDGDEQHAIDWYNTWTTQLAKSPLETAQEEAFLAERKGSTMSVIVTSTVLTSRTSDTGVAFRLPVLLSQGADFNFEFFEKDITRRLGEKTTLAEVSAFRTSLSKLPSGYGSEVSAQSARVSHIMLEDSIGNPAVSNAQFIANVIGFYAETANTEDRELLFEDLAKDAQARIEAIDNLGELNAVREKLAGNMVFTASSDWLQSRNNQLLSANTPGKLVISGLYDEVTPTWKSDSAVSDSVDTLITYLPFSSDGMEPGEIDYQLAAIENHEAAWQKYLISLTEKTDTSLEDSAAAIAIVTNFDKQVQESISNTVTGMRPEVYVALEGARKNIKETANYQRFVIQSRIQGPFTGDQDLGLVWTSLEDYFADVSGESQDFLFQQAVETVVPQAITKAETPELIFTNYARIMSGQLRSPALYSTVFEIGSGEEKKTLNISRLAEDTYHGVFVGWMAEARQISDIEKWYEQALHLANLAPLGYEGDVYTDLWEQSLAENLPKVKNNKESELLFANYLSKAPAGFGPDHKSFDMVQNARDIAKVQFAEQLESYLIQQQHPFGALVMAASVNQIQSEMAAYPAFASFAANDGQLPPLPMVAGFQEEVQFNLVQSVDTNQRQAASLLAFYVDQFRSGGGSLQEHINLKQREIDFKAAQVQGLKDIIGADYFDDCIDGNWRVMPDPNDSEKVVIERWIPTADGKGQRKSVDYFYVGFMMQDASLRSPGLGQPIKNAAEAAQIITEYWEHGAREMKIDHFVDKVSPTIKRYDEAESFGLRARLELLLAENDQLRITRSRQKLEFRIRDRKLLNYNLESGEIKIFGRLRTKGQPNRFTPADLEAAYQEIENRLSLKSDRSLMMLTERSESLAETLSDDFSLTNQLALYDRYEVDQSTLEGTIRGHALRFFPDAPAAIASARKTELLYSNGGKRIGQWYDRERGDKQVVDMLGWVELTISRSAEKEALVGAIVQQKQIIDMARENGEPPMISMPLLNFLELMETNNMAPVGITDQLFKDYWKYDPKKPAEYGFAFTFNRGVDQTDIGVMAPGKRWLNGVENWTGGTDVVSYTYGSSQRNINKGLGIANAELMAFFGGTVIGKNWADANGPCLKIEHAKLPIRIALIHLKSGSNDHLKVGDQVLPEQLLGLVGSVGKGSTGHHLDYRLEVKIDGKWQVVEPRFPAVEKGGRISERLSKVDPENPRFFTTLTPYKKGETVWRAAVDLEEISYVPPEEKPEDLISHLP